MCGFFVQLALVSSSKRFKADPQNSAAPLDSLFALCFHEFSRVFRQFWITKKKKSYLVCADAESATAKAAAVRVLLAAVVRVVVSRRCSKSGQKVRVG